MGTSRTDAEDGHIYGRLANATRAANILSSAYHDVLCTANQGAYKPSWTTYAVTAVALVSRTASRGGFDSSDEGSPWPGSPSKAVASGLSCPPLTYCLARPVDSFADDMGSLCDAQPPEITPCSSVILTLAGFASMHDDMGAIRDGIQQLAADRDSDRERSPSYVLNVLYSPSMLQYYGTGYVPS
ncbi:hypothetical protein NUW54_g9841 [Trametes sanguinea]|uniref:Uncharacterized protein n=1 Tax=Trametes sanguinea TaxID=158606 RepID=A0ACC1P4G4_9APHY|nr:hypothetical protein NUW54_g9841 [Trametes sanguinea]